jgi:hypothetical protein
LRLFLGTGVHKIRSEARLIGALAFFRGDELCLLLFRR